MKRPSAIFCSGLLCLLFWWACIAALILFITGCGGTFALRPDGSIEYTTPRIIRHEK